MHGVLQSFRSDGSLCSEQTYLHGTLDGPFRRYHPNGELARSGRHVSGELDGEMVATASSERTPERLRACCVPPGAWSMRADYSGGRLRSERFFDREGRLLLPDGSIHPDRPEGVPSIARFVPELGRQWVLGAYEQGQRHGRFRFWSELGEALVDAEYARGQAVGRWTLHSDGLERDLGHELVDLKNSPALADERRSPEHWRALSAALFAEQRPAEALCALARAGDPEALTASIARSSLVQPPAYAERLVLELGQRATLERTANALVLGATPSVIFQRLARSLPLRAGSDLIDAAIGLDPNRQALYSTRATLRLQLGELAGARADIERLDPSSAATAALAAYIRTLFWPFEFWPSGEELGDNYSEELPDEVLQPLPAIRSTIQKCAFRLGLSRAVLRARGLSAESWLPPDLSHLHDGADVELGIWEFELTEEEQPVRVTVDETLKLEELDVPALMRTAQRDFAALGWLCWGVGLDRIELPSELLPRPELRRALGTALLRYWICQDRLQTSGLRARMQGAPSFVWRGLSSDELYGPVAELACDTYREMRATLFWLADPECQSLWQDDLRPA